MIEEIKLLLGDAAGNYSDAQINLCYRMALSEVCGNDGRHLRQLRKPYNANDSFPLRGYGGADDSRLRSGKKA